MDVPERQYDLHRQREQRHAGTDAYVGPEPVHHYAFTTATQASISRLAGACKCDGTTPSIRLPAEPAASASPCRRRCSQPPTTSRGNVTDFGASAKLRALLERRLKLWLASDLAADVADEAAAPRAQQAQLPTMALELFGVGVTAGHHR